MAKSEAQGSYFYVKTVFTYKIKCKVHAYTWQEDFLFYSQEAILQWLHKKYSHVICLLAVHVKESLLILENIA